MSKVIPKNRLLAFEKQEGRCYYCRVPMWLENKREFAAKHRITKKLAKRLRCTAEHLNARKDGGKNNRENIAAACLYCNSTRHRASEALSPNEYRKHVRCHCRRHEWHPREFNHLM